MNRTPAKLEQNKTDIVTSVPNYFILLFGLGRVYRAARGKHWASFEPSHLGQEKWKRKHPYLIFVFLDLGRWVAGKFAR